MKTQARPLWIVGLLCWIATAPASGAELAGVTLPDTVTVEGKLLKLNGIGLREKFVFDVYVAGLYLEEPSSDPERIATSQQLKRLHQSFVYKKVSRKKMIDAWHDGFSATALGKYGAEIAKLDGWMEDLVKGDEMIFTELPGGRLEVVVKGQVKGVIEAVGFPAAFWNVFIGSEPPTAALKRGLLGTH